MKRFFIIILALLTFSCKNDKAEPNKGSIACKINGSDWLGKPSGTHRGATLGFGFTKTRKVSGVEVRWQSIGFGIIRKELGDQRLYKRTQLVTTNPDSAKTYSSFSTTQDDGDVVCDIYEIIEADSTTNFIRITKETGDYKEVWGEFSVNMKRTSGCSESTLPDVLRIREGKFHVVLEK